MQGAAAARKPRPAASRAAAKPRAARSTARPATRKPRARSRAAARPAVSGGGVVALPVAAVGRTAHAFSGLADSGLVHGLARSRAWIVLLGVLLAGIVAVNVIGLSLSASNSRVAAKIDQLERDNSVMRGRLAARTSTDRIQKEAAGLGLAIPAPDAIHYLHADDKAASIAAKRLAAGEIGSSLPADATTESAEAAAATTTTETTADPAAETTTTTTTAVDPATGLPLDPVTGLPVDPATGLPIDPATGAPVTSTDTTTAAATP